MALRSLVRMALAAARHPLARQAPASTLGRFVRWQLGARILGHPVVVPFASGTRLVVEPGMTGATGSIYFGLHEFSDMAFVAHVLRAGDLFVDVGANVGTYTVLAAGVAEADVLACEPVGSTYARLARNIAINELGPRVRCAQVALSDRSGLVVMTTGLDTMNRVVTGSQGQSVPSMTLDSLVGDREPSVLKIDVEGHEDAVIAGAVRTLARDSLCAIILEHGESSPALAQVLAAGFTRYQYDPRARSLVTGDEMPRQNSLLVRNSRIADVTSRCRSAPSIDLGWTTV